MAIKMRNKSKVDFSMASMSDLVFLLLIFFMLSSTLIAPNAVKLLLPSSNSKTMAKPASVTVYVDENMTFYVDGVQTTDLSLKDQLVEALKDQQEASVVLKADRTVDVQYIVVVIDAVNQVNKLFNARHKVILATQPRGKS
jgi:biopolymer transport protein ExbD